jgi:cytochrome c
MKRILATAFIGLLAVPAFADGDAAKGEKEFKKCKACHTIEAPDGTAIMKGGKTGPNLYGIVGRTAGTVEGFSYGDSIVAAGAAGLVWDAENFEKYVEDPAAFLKEILDDGSAKSKMTFKLKKGGNDVFAYLASVAE